MTSATNSSRVGRFDRVRPSWYTSMAVLKGCWHFCSAVNVGVTEGVSVGVFVGIGVRVAVGVFVIVGDGVGVVVDVVVGVGDGVMVFVVGVIDGGCDSAVAHALTKHPMHSKTKLTFFVICITFSRVD